MFGLGAGEVIIVLVVALIFIGPKKLPELAKSLGKSMREFQRAKDELMSELDTNQEHPRPKRLDKELQEVVTSSDSSEGSVEEPKAQDNHEKLTREYGLEQDELDEADEIDEINKDDTEEEKPKDP